MATSIGKDSRSAATSVIALPPVPWRVEFIGLDEILANAPAHRHRHSVEGEDLAHFFVDCPRFGPVLSFPRLAAI